MRNPEYDRFGPWILEISEEDPPPPLFLPYLTRSEVPLFNIKIPRKIERRKAHAGMNLYDYMVTLYEADIVILERVGDEVRFYSFPYGDIQYLCLGETLLKGTLQIGMPSQVFELPFSTVSKDLMHRLVDMIRQRYTDAGSFLSMDDEAPFDEELSYLFNGLLAEERVQNPQYSLLVAQGNRAVSSLESGLLRKLLLGAVDKTLLESLHLSDGRELKIISRGRIFKYRWQTVYGKATYMIPLDRITKISWVMDRQDGTLSHLLLDTGAGEIDHGLLSDNAMLNMYKRFLSALTLPL